MSTPALPGLDLAPAPTNPGFSLAAPRAPRRRPNPYLHLESTTERGIRATHCQTCRAPIVVGVDADYCASIVRADVDPLGPLGEMVALLGGRPTYTLEKPVAGYARLFRRNPSRMAAQPCGNPLRPWHRYDVIAVHVCGNPVAESMTIPTMLAFVSPQRIDPNEPAPF